MDNIKLSKIIPIPTPVHTIEVVVVLTATNFISLINIIMNIKKN